MSSDLTLRELRADFGRHRFLATPLAGTIGWMVAGVMGAVLSPFWAAMALFICTGMIFPLGLLLGRLLGEDVTGRHSKSQELDRLFLLTVVMALLVYGIAIPFFLIDLTSLPLSIGILAGLMWVPFSWMIQHWVGLFHGIGRTL